MLANDAADIQEDTKLKHNRKIDLLLEETKKGTKSVYIFINPRLEHHHHLFEIIIVPYCLKGEEEEGFNEWMNSI